MADGIGHVLGHIGEKIYNNGLVLADPPLLVKDQNLDFFFWTPPLVVIEEMIVNCRKKCNTLELRYRQHIQRYILK